MCLSPAEPRGTLLCWPVEAGSNVYGSDEIRTDRRGNPVQRYPVAAEHGRLLGIDAYGEAVYATDDRGTLRVPPRERWLAAEFPLAETGLSPGDYVLYVAKEAGPWRVLADAGHEGVRARDVDPERVVADGPVETDVDALVERVVSADGRDDRAEPAGELRQVAMDHPHEVADHARTLLSLLSGGRPVDPDVADDSTTAPYHVLAARGDLAFARAVRAHPAVVRPVLEELLGLVAAGRASPVDHDRHLLDALDVAGLAEPSGTAASLVSVLGEEAPAARRRALDALYRLEHRHAAGDHPMLSVGELREAVEALERDPNESVREAAAAVGTVHGFHQGPSDADVG
jgi:hypothetical protein